MKVFEGGEPKEWRGKVNFVDKNNVLVGFDDGPNCCEQYGWFLNRSKPTADMLDGDLDHKDLEEYVFDPEYFEELDNPDEHYCGGMANASKHGVMRMLGAIGISQFSKETKMAFYELSDPIRR